MKNWLVIDIDGTLSDERHRLEHAQVKDWNTFQSLCHLDKPHQDMIDIIRHLSHLKLLGLTGRNEKVRGLTVPWLYECGLQFDHLLMRPDDNYDPSPVFKINALEKFFGSKAAVLDSVLAVFDDTDKIVAALRDYGLTVLQPREGAY